MLLDHPLAESPLKLVAHVAWRLNTGEAQVRKLIRDGHLPAIRIGKQWRVDKRDLDAFIEAQRVQIARRERQLDDHLDPATGRVMEVIQRRRRERAEAPKDAA